MLFRSTTADQIAALRGKIDGAEELIGLLNSALALDLARARARARDLALARALALDLARARARALARALAAPLGQFAIAAFERALTITEASAPAEEVGGRAATDEAGRDLGGEG